MKRSVYAGFTLIEMVVALALLGMMAVIVFESLRFGQRSYEKTVRRGNESWQTFVSQRLIRSIIESAYPQEPAATDSVLQFGLQGNERNIAVTAPAPMAGGAGLYRYEITLRSRPAGMSDVVVRWRPDFARTAVTDSELAEEVLLERVASLQWSYRGDVPSVRDQHDNGGWLDGWEGQRTLPRLVRLRVVFAPSDSRRWPDLIMATRISDDANCLFDPVSQRCRRDAS